MAGGRYDVIRLARGTGETTFRPAHSFLFWVPGFETSCVQGFFFWVSVPEASRVPRD
jgi:hypothetical protein